MDSRTITLFDDLGAPKATVAGDVGLLVTGPDAPMWAVEGDYLGQGVYVVDGRVTPLPSNPAQLSGQTLTSLPVPCTIHINEAVYPCADSTAELEFSQPGTYHVRVEAWPYLDKEFIIENPA